MTHDLETGVLVPSTLDDLFALVPELQTIATFDRVFITDIDSTNMTPALWVTIAKAIAERIDDYDGFVITHGTDTMAYTASALSFLLQGLSKPVILTGAQMPLNDLHGSDAHNNLVFAGRFATEDVAEVAIFFGTELLRGNRARKFSQFDFDAFKSFNIPAIGKIGIRPKLADHRVRRAPRRLLPVVPKLAPVFLLKYFPGMGPEIFAEIVKLKYRGIVIEGVGAGNLPSAPEFQRAIRNVVKKGIPVVMTTQCIVGAAEMFIYEVGKIAEQCGAISALDMTPEAALTKLAWVLTQTKKLPEIKAAMQRSLVGEVGSS